MGGGSVLALLLAVALLAAPAAARRDEVPASCQEWDEGYECEWTLGEAVGAGSSLREPVPVFPRTLATLVVTVNGNDNGWSYAFFRERQEGERSSTRPVSFGSHGGSGLGDMYAITTRSLLLEGVEGDSFLFGFTANQGTGGASLLNGDDPVAPGSVKIRYLATPLPEGRPPERPAATRDVPHVLDLARDARAPEADISAAWLDDASVGDGVFEATLLVENLTRVDYNFSLPREAASGTSRIVEWSIGFDLRGEAFELAYTRTATSFGPQAVVISEFCAMYGPGDELRTSPLCDVDEANGTIQWRVPESSLGNPGAGVPFEGLRAHARREAYSSGTRYYETMEDEAIEERFPFALGGPAVWDELNGCAFCPPPVEPAAFYEAPLAPENVADSLQVVGAAVALLTFLVGLVVVRRTRRRTDELLRRVDALVHAHERNAREALKALGHLESEFAAMYREGRINETQYQLATQRLVAAASRMALRRELGLDDAAPG